MYIYNKKTRYYLNDDNTILIFLPNFQNIVELRYYSGSVVKTKIWDFYNELIWLISYKEHGENSGALPSSNIC